MNYVNLTMVNRSLEMERNIDFQINEIICFTIISHMSTLMVILSGQLFSDLSHTCSEEECTPDLCSEVHRRKGLIIFKEFIIVVVTLVLATTILSGFLRPVVCIILVINIVLISKFYLIHPSVTNYDVYNIRDILKLPIPDTKRSFVTCCRSLVNILTVISILAVDFKIFPKKFSKTGKYGMSFMDYGVGFFILSNAAVLKLENVINQGFRQCLVGSLVLFIIGALRCVILREINYGVNVLEYGVHWNFFFTLGIVRFLTFFIIRVFKYRSFISGYILCLLHQYLLSTGIENYVLGNKTRDNLIDANREGLISALGYTSLYLIGVSLNKYIVKTSSDVKGDIKSIAKVIMISLVLFLISSTLSINNPPCRRVVNMTYITWVLTIAGLNIAAAMSVELFIIIFIQPSTTKETFYNFLTPVIFEAVNKNGLFFFLLGNLLTGLVNILFNTKNLSSFESVFILVTYMVANCTTITIMYCKKIVFKFW